MVDKAGDALEGAGDIAGNIKDTAGGVVSGVVGKAGDLVEGAGDLASKAKDAVTDNKLFDEAKDALSSIKDSVSDKIYDAKDAVDDVINGDA